MKKFILIVSLAASFQAFSQTKCDIQNHYGDFIEIKKGNHKGKDYLNPELITVDAKYCFADYVNKYPLYMYYFLTSFCPSYTQDKDNLINIKDSLALQSAFITVLQEDSLFSTIMQELTEKVFDKSVPKDTITMNTLLGIAAKYFYVLKISEEGHYVGKVCSGINGIAETEAVRKPFIEAFASTAILKHYYSKEYNMYNELVHAIKDLYKINLGIDNNERLLRARGALFMQMFYNQKLRDMLLYEYERQKEYLPFVLSDI